MIVARQSETLLKIIRILLEEEKKESISSIQEGLKGRN